MRLDCKHLQVLNYSKHSLQAYSDLHNLCNRIQFHPFVLY